MVRMRTPPKMTGIFSDLANDFIAYKRSLGYKYEHEPKCLSRFCRFSTEFGLKEVVIPKELVEAWIAYREGEAQKTRSHRITCIRQFSLYLEQLGYQVYHLPKQKFAYPSSFTPYIFTHEEIGRLFFCIDKTEPRRNVQNMHLSLPVIFRILYGCGLRVSEVLKLRVEDVDLKNGLLILHETKTEKDRLIPLSTSVHQACLEYSKMMVWSKTTDYFFLSPTQTMISPMTIYQRYRQYLERAGISHGGKGKGPRLHDIRHTFAVHVLQKWVKQKIDLTAMLPILSTYMGHKDIQATANYLKLTAEVYPDLLEKIEKDCSFVIPEVSQ